MTNLQTVRIDQILLQYDPRRDRKDSHPVSKLLLCYCAPQYMHLLWCEGKCSSSKTPVDGSASVEWAITWFDIK